MPARLEHRRCFCHGFDEARVIIQNEHSIAGSIAHRLLNRAGCDSARHGMQMMGMEKGKGGGIDELVMHWAARDMLNRIAVDEVAHVRWWWWW